MNTTPDPFLAENSEVNNVNATRNTTTLNQIQNIARKAMLMVAVALPISAATNKTTHALEPNPAVSSSTSTSTSTTKVNQRIYSYIQQKDLQYDALNLLNELSKFPGFMDFLRGNNEQNGYEQTLMNNMENGSVKDAFATMVGEYYQWLLHTSNKIRAEHGKEPITAEAAFMEHMGLPKPTVEQKNPRDIKQTTIQLQDEKENYYITWHSNYNGAVINGTVRNTATPLVAKTRSNPTGDPRLANFSVPDEVFAEVQEYRRNLPYDVNALKAKLQQLPLFELFQTETNWLANYKKHANDDLFLDPLAAVLPQYLDWFSKLDNTPPNNYQDWWRPKLHTIVQQVEGEIESFSDQLQADAYQIDLGEDYYVVWMQDSDGNVQNASMVEIKQIPSRKQNIGLERVISNDPFSAKRFKHKLLNNTPDNNTIAQR